MKLKILAVAGLLLVSGGLCAQTPDGQTPADEGICNSEFGPAYGLCVSYCEAMDCDNPESNSSDKACQKHFDNFLDLTGHEPPCEGSPPGESLCPCLAKWQRSDLFPNPADATFSGCGYIEVLGADGYFSKFIMLQIGDINTASEPYGEIEAGSVFDPTDQYVYCASYSGFEWLPEDFEGGIQLENVYPERLELFEQEQEVFYSSCFLEVEKIAEQFGIECNSMN